MNRLATFAVASLAAHRAARAVAVDNITEPIRHRVIDALERPSMTGDQVNVRRSAAREYAAEMIDCPHCAGFWLSWISLAALTVAQRRRWHWLEFAVAAWAVAGVQSTLASIQAAADTVGHVDADDVNDANEAITTAPITASTWRKVHD